jgi:entericidin B
MLPFRQPAGFCLSLSCYTQNNFGYKRKILWLRRQLQRSFLLVLSSVLTACNTTRGVGQDISEGGSAISGAATKAQQ